MGRNLKVIYNLTREIPPDFDGERGRINRELIQKYIDNVEDKVWYICGPPEMVKKIKEILHTLNIKDDKIIYEAWMMPGK